MVEQAVMFMLRAVLSTEAGQDTCEVLGKQEMETEYTLHNCSINSTFRFNSSNYCIGLHPFRFIFIYYYATHFKVD